MTITLFIFIFLTVLMYLIITSIIYLIYDGYLYEKFEQKVAHKQRIIGQKILMHLHLVKQGESIPTDDIKELTQKLNQRVYRQAFNNFLIELTSSDSPPSEITEYMKNYESYLQEIVKIKIPKRTASSRLVKVVSVAYMLGKYKLDRYYINEFLLQCVKSNSFYLKWEAFSSLVEIQNIEYILKALKHLSEHTESGNYHICVDIIDSYTGNMNELNQILLSKITTYSSLYQTILVNHFHNTGYEQAREMLLELFQQTNNAEVKFAIIRYLGDYQNRQANNLLTSLLSSPEWEYRAVSAKALGNYQNEHTINALVQVMSDNNWYVRNNSAHSLIKIVDEYRLTDILSNIDDQYALESIDYAIVEQAKGF